MNSLTKNKCSHHSINKTMEPSQPNPGDTVIPLADLVVKATIISGPINSAIITWKFNQSWWLTLAAFVIGAIVCWFLARDN
jgi:Ca2+-dependent lipid-binding protein